MIRIFRCLVNPVHPRKSILQNRQTECTISASKIPLTQLR